MNVLRGGKVEFGELSASAKKCIPWYSQTKWGEMLKYLRWAFQRECNLLKKKRCMHFNMQFGDGKKVTSKTSNSIG